MQAVEFLRLRGPVRPVFVRNVRYLLVGRNRCYEPTMSLRACGRLMATVSRPAPNTWLTRLSRCRSGACFALPVCGRSMLDHERSGK
jgi:hypothetical protein